MFSVQHNYFLWSACERNAYGDERLQERALTGTTMYSVCCTEQRLLRVLVQMFGGSVLAVTNATSFSALFCIPELRVHVLVLAVVLLLAHFNIPSQISLYKYTCMFPDKHELYNTCTRSVKF